MPDTHGPWDGSAFGQAPDYRDRGPREPSGVYGTPQSSAAAGDLGLTVAGFGLSLGLGRAHVRGAAYERTGTAWTDTVPANTHATQTRIDRLVLRRDLVAKTVVPVRLQGTPAATPVSPALTQDENGAWDLPLFRFTVPPASGTPLVVTDERRWVNPDTGRLILPRLFAFADVARIGFAAGWQDLDLNAEAIDTHGAHTTGAALAVGQRYFTVPEGQAGRYRVGGGCVFGAFTSGSSINARVLRNDAAFRGCTGVAARADTAGSSSVTGSKLLDLAVGDRVHVQGFCSSTWDTGIFTDAAPWMSVERID